MGGHEPRQPGIQGKGQQIGLQSVRHIGGANFGQGGVAVHPGAAMAGGMLGHRLDAGGEQPRRHRRPQRRHGFGRFGEGAVADHRIGAGKREIENRRGDDVEAWPIEAGGAALGPDRRPVQPGGAQPGGRIARMQRPDRGGRGMAQPVRRAQPRDPAALLIQHKHRLWRQHAAQIGDQPGQPGGRIDITPEQDHPRRRAYGKQSRLPGQQIRTAHPQDQRPHQTPAPSRATDKIPDQTSPLNRRRARSRMCSGESEAPTGRRSGGDRRAP